MFFFVCFFVLLCTHHKFSNGPKQIEWGRSFPSPPHAHQPQLLELLFTETSTIGARVIPCERYALQRREITVETHLGPVRCKIAMLNGKVVNAKPEFDDCAALAQANPLWRPPYKDISGGALPWPRPCPVLSWPRLFFFCFRACLLSCVCVCVCVCLCARVYVC